MIGTTLNQRFTLDKELGRGGMGAVYRATDQVLQRTVAIKILKDHTGDEVGRKIRMEAQILARLLHENVVRLYDFGEAGGTYYFVMEEVVGSSFARRWKQIALPERLRVLAQVADALDYAHHQGVIHRDVKPANVLMTAGDSAKLSDFGLSLVVDDAQVPGMVKGTPHYMSPEQASGRRIDHRTDLYALGVMLYECTAGTPPFLGPPLAVMTEQVNNRPDPPRSRNPSISAALEELTLRLLEKHPEARPASGSAVAQEIRDLLATDPTLRDPASIGGSGDSSGSFRLTPPSPSRSSVSGFSGESSLWTGPTRGSGLDPVSAPTIAPATAPATGLDRVRALAMLGDVVAGPVPLLPDERYYCGHYLAYLLGGSRRQGFLGRRPLDPLNADRARLLLAMTWLMGRGDEPGDDEVARAADLLQSRFDVRPLLGPVVVVKYLAARDSAGRRRAFRSGRKRLQDASPYARGAMTDEKGMLNPGLMPQALGDLSKVAPARSEVDDLLIGRWNRVAEVWRARPDFRAAVLGYATTSAWREPAALELWPEVVYPLIERARWQRKRRSGAEAAWDAVAGAFRLPDSGLKLDRAIQQVVPRQVVEQLDLSLGAFAEDPHLDFEAPAARSVEAVPAGVRLDVSSFHDLDVGPDPDKAFAHLASPDPIRLTLGELRELYLEATQALRDPGARAGHRHVPIGPYRLAVIPSVRGKSAGQVAIQGMHHKQVEMLIPSLRLATSAAKPILAVWVYRDNSLAIAYLDYRNAESFISWHAPTNQQNNYDDAASLNSALLQLGLEAPDQLDRALSKRFRPRNPV